MCVCTCFNELQHLFPFFSEMWGCSRLLQSITLNIYTQNSKKDTQAQMCVQKLGFILPHNIPKIAFTINRNIITLFQEMKFESGKRACKRGQQKESAI